MRVIKETLRLVFVFADIMLLIRVAGFGRIWPRRQGIVLAMLRVRRRWWMRIVGSLQRRQLLFSVWMRRLVIRVVVRLRMNVWWRSLALDRGMGSTVWMA
jgi:hypothetical protein